MTRQVLCLAVAAGLVACALTGRASGAAAEDPFLQGLQQRGLTSLMEVYLKQKGIGGPAVPGTGEAGRARASTAADEKAALASLEAQKAAKARTMAERETYFKKAREYYEQAVQDAGKAASTAAGDQRHLLRLQTLTLRMDLANMILQKWLKTDLDLLEVTDRRGGDRNHTLELLKACTDQYKAISSESAQWLSELDRLTMAERSKFVNTGAERKLRQLQRETKFDEAWVLYYTGWLLPRDYVPPTKKERTRKEILEDAITAFQAFMSLPDTVSAKWYAHLVVALAYRELGKFNEAMQSLAMAENTAAPEALKIRVAYERALTLLKKGDLKAAHKAVAEARTRWKDKLETELYGVALPIVESDIYIAEAEQTGDKSLKSKGLAILQKLNDRPQPWPQVVQWVTGIAASDVAMTDAELDRLSPFELYVKATAVLEKADKTKDATQCRLAVDLFKRYLAKVKPDDQHYAEAMYAQAACLLQMGRKVDAAALFQKVADEAPQYRYAADAARYAVAASGDAYEREATEENRAAYEEALRWFVGKWLQTDPDQQYYYAMILFRGKKFTEAADAFAKVPQASEYYPDSRYWIPLCRLEQFREKILPTGDKALILTRSRVVGQELLSFADYALAANGLPDKKKQELLTWAETAYVTVADIYLYPEVALPSDVLAILDTVEKRFTLDDDARGRVLKLRIDALQKLGKLDESLAELDKFLKLAKPEDVGPVLRGLFRALTDDVRDLVKRGDKESVQVAGAKVEQAKKLCEKLTNWINSPESKLADQDKALRIENNRYDLAELFLAVRNYTGAIDIYKEIGGDKPWVVEKGQTLKIDCVYGMARAYEGLGEQAQGAAVQAGQKAPPYSPEAKRNYETALEIWRVLQDVASAEGPQTVWDRRYHVFYCSFRVGNAADVAGALKKLAIIERPNALGGKDPVLQMRFRELLSLVAAALGA